MPSEKMYCFGGPRNDQFVDDVGEIFQTPEGAYQRTKLCFGVQVRPAHLGGTSWGEDYYYVFEGLMDSDPSPLGLLLKRRRDEMEQQKWMRKKAQIIQRGLQQIQADGAALPQVREDHPIMRDGYWCVEGHYFRIKTYPDDSDYAAGRTVLAHWRGRRTDERYRGIAFVDRCARKVRMWPRIIGMPNLEPMVRALQAFLEDPSLGLRHRYKRKHPDGERKRRLHELLPEEEG
jgi:hypothetical protein